MVKTETCETLRLLTNDLDAPAQEIADLYKRRWQIELFFRLMKQTLRILSLWRFHEEPGPSRILGATR